LINPNKDATLISRSNAIDKYAQKFGIPTEIAEKFKKSGKPFYFTKDPVGITVMPGD